MSKTTCHGRIESIYFGSHIGRECDVELELGGQVLGVLLVVAVEGLISSDPCIIAVGPYKSDNATGPFCQWLCGVSGMLCR
jgi:hypothetical protein